MCLHRARAAALGGFEFACAIPGTAGGGVWMNAGAYGGDIAGVLERALVVDARGAAWRTPEQLGFEYRRSELRHGRGRGRGEFRLRPRPVDEIKATVAEMQAAAQGGAADEQADVRQRLQEPRARADGRADARGLRASWAPDRRRADLPQARELHRERRRRPVARRDRADDRGAPARARGVRRRARARGSAPRADRAPAAGEERVSGGEAAPRRSWRRARPGSARPLPSGWSRRAARSPSASASSPPPSASTSARARRPSSPFTRSRSRSGPRGQSRAGRPGARALDGTSLLADRPGGDPAPPRQAAARPLARLRPCVPEHPSRQGRASSGRSPSSGEATRTGSFRRRGGFSEQLERRLPSTAARGLAPARAWIRTSGRSSGRRSRRGRSRIVAAIGLRLPVFARVWYVKTGEADGDGGPGRTLRDPAGSTPDLPLKLAVARRVLAELAPEGDRGVSRRQRSRTPGRSANVSSLRLSLRLLWVSDALTAQYDRT